VAESIFDFFTREAGQKRRRALDDAVGGLLEYLTPQNLHPAAEFVAQSNPIQGMSDSMAASGVVFDPEQTADARKRAALDMGMEMAFALTPAALAARGYLTPVQGVMEGLLGGSPAQKVITDDIVERFTQLGEVPVMGSGLGGAYEMIGSDLRKNMGNEPSSREITGQNFEGKGANFSNMKAQRSSIIDDHYSRGLLSTEMTPPVPITYNDLAGKTIMGLVGDPTARKTVTQIGDLRLENPVDVQAGAEFMDIYGYASARSAMSAQLQEAASSDDAFFTFLNMAEKSGDFAKHTGEAVGEAFRAAMTSNSNPILRDKIPMINEKIRKIGVPKSEKVVDSNGNEILLPSGNPKTKNYTVYPFENFKSVEDPNYMAEYIASIPTGSERAAFIKGLDKDALQKAGVPNIGQIRVALANPDLIGRDFLSAGYRGFFPDYDKGLMDTTDDIHRTYDTYVEKVGPSYTLDQGGGGVPANLLFVDKAEKQRAKGTGGLLVPTSPDYKQYEMSPEASKQFMDDRAVEIADTFVEIEKRFGRGAALRYADELLSGGRISGSMIDSARKANAPGIY